jgi:PAS domain S-box-containing protein
MNDKYLTKEQLAKELAATHRKIADLQKKEEPLNKTSFYLDRINDSVIAINEKGVIRKVNREFSNLWGYNSEEVEGKSVLMLFPEKEIPKYRTKLKEAITSKKVLTFETIALTKTGEEVPVSVRGSASFSEHGNVKGFVGVFRDIAERAEAEKLLKRSEAQYKAVLSAIPDLMFRLSKNGEHLDYYAPLKNNLYLNPDEFLGKPVDEVMPKKVGEAYLVHIAEALNTGHMQVFEDSLKFPEGLRYFETRMVVCGKDETLSIVRDITEKKKSEKVIIESQKQLKRQRKLLERKTAALSEIVKQINVEKEKIKEDVAENVEKTLLPILSKLSLSEESLKYKDLLAHHLQELASSFGHDISQKSYNLTLKEIEICNMIKGGLSNKEICGLLHISGQTVEKHRKNIRKKMGLTNKKINLASFLQQI